jgi:hypothetical protein
MQIDKPVLGSILCSLFGFLLGLMALLSGTHGLLEQGHILRVCSLGGFPLCYMLTLL